MLCSGELERPHMKLGYICVSFQVCVDRSVCVRLAHAPAIYSETPLNGHPSSGHRDIADKLLWPDCFVLYW